jgi:hypothetical protein
MYFRNFHEFILSEGFEYVSNDKNVDQETEWLFSKIFENKDIGLDLKVLVRFTDDSNDISITYDHLVIQLDDKNEYYITQEINQKSINITESYDNKIIFYKSILKEIKNETKFNSDQIFYRQLNQDYNSLTRFSYFLYTAIFAALFSFFVFVQPDIIGNNSTSSFIFHKVIPLLVAFSYGGTMWIIYIERKEEKRSITEKIQDWELKKEKIKIISLSRG